MLWTMHASATTHRWALILYTTHYICTHLEADVLACLHLERRLIIYTYICVYPLSCADSFTLNLYVPLSL
jgi:hypothetical protein